MSDIIALIEATPSLAELLARRFDFDLARTEPVEEIRLANGEPVEPIAGDASGGTYFVTPSGAVIYADSEGSGGLIALNLRDALAIVVGLPSLHDALSLPLDDDLPARLAEADDEIREDDALYPNGELSLDEARAHARQALNLPSADGLLAELHRAAADDDYRPISEHGPYESMLSS